MVQVYYGNGQPWDNHDDILQHREHAANSDAAIAALLQDLKASGKLQETVVIVGGEFGRTLCTLPRRRAFANQFVSCALFNPVRS